MATYCTNKQLKPLIKHLQDTGEMKNELVEFIHKIVIGVHQRLQMQWVDVDDLLQNVVIICIKKKDCFNLSKNLFNYITTITYNEAFKDQRTTNAQYRAIEKYVNGLSKEQKEKLQQDQDPDRTRGKYKNWFK